MSKSHLILSRKDIIQFDEEFEVTLEQVEDLSTGKVSYNVWENDHKGYLGATPFSSLKKAKEYYNSLGEAK